MGLGQTAEKVATGVLVVCALTITSIVVRREIRSRDAGIDAAKPRLEENWRDYSKSGRRIGAHDAAVTIVEFADFECSYCKRFAGYADSLWSLGKRFSLVYRHFPLARNRFAVPAATASECAADQGRFKEVHDELYAHTDSMGQVPWWWFAKRAGVPDSVAFQTCIVSMKPFAAIERDTIDGMRLGVSGTPTLLIGRLRLDGVPPFDSLAAYIDRAASDGDNEALRD